MGKTAHWKGGILILGRGILILGKNVLPQEKFFPSRVDPTEKKGKNENDRVAYLLPFSEPDLRLPSLPKGLSL